MIHRVGEPLRGLTALVVLCLLALSAPSQTLGAEGPTEAMDLPPWASHQLPAWAESVRILARDQPLRARPDATSSRRGSAALEMRLPLFGARPGPGCRRLWLQVGPQAWTCRDDVELAPDAPIAADRSVLPPHNGLPFRYFFAGPDGSLGYDQLDQVDWGEPSMRLERGFAVAIIEERVLDGMRYGLTNQGLWVPMRDFGPARPFDFSGAEIGEVVGDALPLAWVVVEHAKVRRRRGQSYLPTGETIARFTRVDVLEERKGWSGSFVRIDEDRWLESRALRRPTLAPPPDEPEIARGARWIDVELATQTLVAYEGDRPVFATLVSTGKGKTEGHPFETPKGVHRIWVKLLSTTMDNLEDERAGRYWRIEDVPYVQFFHRGVGLHGAFWHRSFGRVRSHGCVNLAPHDAKRLFTWTQPRLPAGWTAALPTRYDRGTIVRVR